MAYLTLVSGGCRSGKSDFAGQLAEQTEGRRLFIATSPCFDEEMKERIDRHRAVRANKGWQTVEEEFFPDRVILETDDETTILLDCLTLWISNLLLEREGKKEVLGEDKIIALAGQLLAACEKHNGSVIMVTNEVGLGIVPDNPLARKYRDLVGRCNQIIAGGADRVFLVSCGIPVQLK
jgi:adenosylcobinamide kinase/adenosylcobinamide-phosphate guanylyltransferase